MVFIVIYVHVLNYYYYITVIGARIRYYVFMIVEASITSFYSDKIVLVGVFFK